MRQAQRVGMCSNTAFTHSSAGQQAQSRGQEESEKKEAPAKQKDKEDLVHIVTLIYMLF